MPRVLLNLGVMIATSGLAFASPTPPASGQPSIDDALSMLEQKAWPFGRVGPADGDGTSLLLREEDR